MSEEAMCFPFKNLLYCVLFVLSVPCLNAMEVLGGAEGKWCSYGLNSEAASIATSCHEAGIKFETKDDTITLTILNEDGSKIQRDFLAVKVAKPADYIQTIISFLNVCSNDLSCKSGPTYGYLKELFDGRQAYYHLRAFNSSQQSLFPFSPWEYKVISNDEEMLIVRRANTALENYLALSAARLEQKAK